MPHIPIHASEKFKGSSKRGIYGDAIQELDWSTGEIFKALKENGIDDNTLVIFTSDNGPNLSFNGNAGPLRGQKGNTYEGGVRVPFIARWPGKIPGGKVNDEAITAMDLLPTLTKLAGGEIPADPEIDGKDIWPLLSAQEGAKSPHEAIHYIKGAGGAHGIRVGDWKYRFNSVKIKLSKEEKKHLSQEEQKALIKKKLAGMGVDSKGRIRELYNLKKDIGEKLNLIDQYPEIAKELQKKMDDFNESFAKKKKCIAKII